MFKFLKHAQITEVAVTETFESSCVLEEWRAWSVLDLPQTNTHILQWYASHVQSESESLSLNEVCFLLDTQESCMIQGMTFREAIQTHMRSSAWGAGKTSCSGTRSGINRYRRNTPRIEVHRSSMVDGQTVLESSNWKHLRDIIVQRYAC